MTDAEIREAREYGHDWLTQQPNAVMFFEIGSARIPGSHPQDVDFLVLWAGANTDFLDWDCGWFPSLGEEYLGDGWMSFRKGNVNLIVTGDAEFFELNKRASDVCVALGLKDKADRILVHKIVRDGYRIYKGRE